MGARGRLRRRMRRHSPNRISLCMIARDEEPVLARCLDSFRDAVDEIIVVDTGSRDETPRIAESFGARVIHHEWANDFSRARNLSLDAATGQWLLVIDADEVLLPGGAAALRRAVKDQRAAGFMLRFHNLGEDGKSLDCTLLRLFRNAPGVRFHNVIHEQILRPLKLWAAPRGLVIPDLDVTIEHCGYLKSEVARKGKEERNLRLFERQLEVYPDDAYSWYKYADYIREDQPTRALQALERAVEIMEQLPDAEALELVFGAEVYAMLAMDVAGQDDLQRAWELVEYARARHETTPNLLFARASVARRRGRSDLARQCYEALLRWDGRILPVPVQPGITGPVAHYGLGILARESGEFDRAEAAFEKALELWPHYQDAAFDLAELRSRRAQPEGALAAVLAYLEARPDDGLAYMRAADLLARHGCWHEALRALERPAAAPQPPPLVLFDRALLALLDNEPQEQALDPWKRLPPGPEATAAHWLAGAWKGQPAPPPADEAGARLVSRAIERCLRAGRGDLVDLIVNDLASRPPTDLSAPLLAALASTNKLFAGAAP